MLLFLPPMKSLTEQSQRAFTLIEILAVVAILAVLAAFLAPVFNSIQGNALAAKNLTNLRNIQAANIGYASDHDGEYVPTSIWDSEGKGTHWHDNKTFRSNYLGIAESGPWPEKMISPLSTIRDSNGRRVVYRSYGMNITGLTSIPFGTPDARRQMRSSQIKNPSKTMVFADALDWQIQMSGADRYAGREDYVQNGIAYRYNGRAGVVFFDGHTEMLTREQVVNNAELWNLRE